MQLNDNWDYAPDDNLARNVFSGVHNNDIIPRANTPSPLCPRCSRLELWSPACKFKDSPVGLQKKAEESKCELCRLLLQSTQSRVEGHSTIVGFSRVASYLTLDHDRKKPVANLYNVPHEFKHQSTSRLMPPSLQGIQIGFPKLPVAGSAIHFKVLKEWIRSCDHDHDCYPKAGGRLPSRLLDLGDIEGGVIRLVQTGDTLDSKPYVALSHRWGSSQQHERFSTFRSNIEELMCGIEVARLPPTFRDAVRVTRGLGLRHLWIDSLCIVQDDPDDWETESKLMERVFSGAYCTIAASCAAGSSDGFLKPRPDRRSVTMLGPRGQDDTYYVSEAIDDFHGDVDQSDLNQRGWVLQERALSRRTIYFTARQLYWECGGGVRCETMTMMKNRKASFLGDANFPHSVAQHVKGLRIEMFQDLYQHYSRLALSFPFDRPIAIRGLETRLIDTFGTTGGLGVFDIYLHRSLLWQRASDALTAIDSFRGTTVPSWSWMAYNGPISYLPIPFGETEWSEDIRSPFVKSASQEVPSQRGLSCRDGRAGTAELTAPVWGLVDAGGGQMIIDDPRRTFVDSIQCVVVGKSKNDHDGELQKHWVLLVHCITRIDDGPSIYERAGVGIMQRRHIAFNGPQKMARIQ